MSTAVRIDTVRNQLGAIRTLLDDMRLEIDDLDAIAWERHRNSDDPKVRGGSRDYALDNNGNPTARAALDILKHAITRTCQDLAVALNEASYVLRDGDNPGNTSRTLITHAELADALAARTRRIEQGTATSHRRLPQPGRDRALKAAVTRAEKAEAEARGLRRRLDRATAELANRRDRGHTA